MRFITLSRDQFDDFLYPIYRATGVDSEEDLETTIRLNEKFRVVASPEEMSQEQVAAIEARGSKAIPDLKLNKDSVQLGLEEDEWKLLIKKFRVGMGIISSAAAEDLMEVLTILKNPPKERVEQ